jgi:hypothetical protein
MMKNKAETRARSQNGGRCPTALVKKYYQNGSF